MSDQGTGGPQQPAAPEAAGAAPEQPGKARERRASLRVPVTMWVEEITDGVQVFRRAGNLSQGGLYLDKTIPIPIGSKVKLRFALPGDGDPVTVEAEIVSIDPELELGMGVKFVAYDADARARIERFVAQSQGG